MTLKSGARKVIKQGEALAEVVNTLHNGRAISKTPVKILVFYAGSSDSKITEKAPAEPLPASEKKNQPKKAYRAVVIINPADSP